MSLREGFPHLRCGQVCDEAISEPITKIAHLHCAGASVASLAMKIRIKKEVIDSIDLLEKLILCYPITLFRTQGFKTEI
jgi:hypothetical protein